MVDHALEEDGVRADIRVLKVDIDLIAVNIEQMIERQELLETRFGVLEQKVDTLTGAVAAGFKEIFDRLDKLQSISESTSALAHRH